MQTVTLVYLRIYLHMQGHAQGQADEASAQDHELLIVTRGPALLINMVIIPAGKNVFRSQLELWHQGPPHIPYAMGPVGAKNGPVHMCMCVCQLHTSTYVYIHIYNNTYTQYKKNMNYNCNPYQMHGAVTFLPINEI